jgi:hypothetical protein
MNTQTQTAAGEESHEALCEALERVLQSSVFSSTERSSGFLRYIFDATLSGQTKQLNQYDIAMDVFDQDEDFDPVTNAIVRVEAGRLRSRLREYYNDEGLRDNLVIELPKGG